MRISLAIVALLLLGVFTLAQETPPICAEETSQN
jgi:hypothetical protein